MYDGDIEWIKDELDKLRKEVQNLQGLAGMKDSLDNLLKQIKNLENAIKDKVGCDVFDEEIRLLKQMLAGIARY